MMNISNDNYIILISYQPFKRLDSYFILLLTIDESNRLMVVLLSKDSTQLVEHNNILL